MRRRGVYGRAGSDAMAARTAAFNAATRTARAKSEGASNVIPSFAWCWIR